MFGAIFIKIVLISIIYTNIHTTQPKFLQLKDLVDEVLARNPSLSAVNSRIKAASIAVPRVQILEFPELTVRTMDNPLGRKSKDSEFFPQVQVELAQRFPWPGKLRTKGEIAQKVLEFLQSEEITTQKELILQTKKLFFQLLLNGIALEINKNNRDILLRLIDGSLVLYKTGRGSQDDILKIELELQELEQELLALESEQQSIKAMINALRNKPQNEPIYSPETRFSPYRDFIYDELEAIAFKRRSELQGIEATIEEQKAMARLSRLGYFPDFTISAMYQHHTKIPHDRAWGLSVTIDLPLWADAREGREMREAQARAQAQEYTLENMKAQIRGRIRELLANIKALEERILLYDHGLLPKTVQSLAAVEAQYRVGKGGFLLLLDTRRQLQNYELDYARVRIMRELFLAELERAIGASFDEFWPEYGRSIYSCHNEIKNECWRKR